MPEERFKKLSIDRIWENFSGTLLFFALKKARGVHVTMNSINSYITVSMVINKIENLLIELNSENI